MRRMYSEKELQTISKQIADEEIASNVIANPEDAGETELSGIQIGDDKYIIPQGTEVIANPDPAGETALTGLQIGEDKYVISAGKQLYQHIITISTRVASGGGQYTTTGKIIFSLILDVDTVLNTASLIKDYMPANKAIPVSGYFKGPSATSSWSDPIIAIPTTISCSTSRTLSFNYILLDGTSTSETSFSENSFNGSYSDAVVAL